MEPTKIMPSGLHSTNVQTGIGLIKSLQIDLSGATYSFGEFGNSERIVLKKLNTHYLLLLQELDICI